MYGRKRSDFQVELFEIDGKRHIVSRIPGPSDFWADATPENRFRSTVLIIFFCLGILVMDSFSLHWGGVASEAQLLKGTLATEAEKTGPNRHYWGEAWTLTRTEVARRDPRVRAMDVNMETHPERNRIKYGNPHNSTNGYIGNGRYEWCFFYFAPGQGQTKFIYGTAIVRLDQQKQLGLFVRQEWIVEDYKITYSEIRKRCS